MQIIPETTASEVTVSDIPDIEPKTHKRRRRLSLRKRNEIHDTCNRKSPCSQKDMKNVSAKS